MLEEKIKHNYQVRPGIDFLSKEFHCNPFPTLIKMLEEYPVCQIEPEGIWAVSRYKDVEFVLMHPQIFSAAAAGSLYDADWLREECRVRRLLTCDDPPEYGKYYDFVTRSFARQAVRKLEPLMKGTAQSLLINLSSKGKVNFTESFSYPYVGKITKHIVGLGERQSLNELREWVELEQKITPTRPDDNYIKAFEAALLRQNSYFQDVIEERRKTPQDDLVTHLINAQSANGEKLDNHQICGLLCLVVSAGYMTTIQMLNHAIVMLSENPNLVIELSNAPELISDFVEELLRYRPSTLGTIRKTIKEVELSGVTIPKGQFVIPLTAAANRDHRKYLNPNTFDITRNCKHLAFGRGVHICIGAALARQEIKIALEVLLNTFTQFSCASEDEVTWIDSLFVYGMSELPASFS